MTAEEATPAIAYLEDGKRLVEVLLVEGEVVTVHDCADADPSSSFKITGVEISEWRAVDCG